MRSNYDEPRSRGVIYFFYPSGSEALRPVGASSYSQPLFLLRQDPYLAKTDWVLPPWYVCDHRATDRTKSGIRAQSRRKMVDVFGWRPSDP